MPFLLLAVVVVVVVVAMVEVIATFGCSSTLLEFCPLDAIVSGLEKQKANYNQGFIIH